MRRYVLLFALAATVVSCSLDYGQASPSSRIGEDIPDTILFELSHTIVRDGIPRFLVTASRAESFEKRRRQYLYEVEFRELDAGGKMVAQGRADRAEFMTDTEDMTLSGNLSFYSSREDAWLTTDYLAWSSAERRLVSRPEDLVSVRTGTGTTIRGRGFTAEMASSLIRFDSGVSGTIVEER